MRKLTFIALVALFWVACNTNPNGKTTKNAHLIYPETLRDTVVDDFFGKKIPDPYRWLEDPNSEATKDWVFKQNRLTFSYLDEIPFHNQIEKRLEKLWNFERFSAPFFKAGKYYYYKNDGLQNQSVLYRERELGGDGKVVLDPNKLSVDGTTAVPLQSISKDGRYLAYGIAEGGSDWRSIFIKDLEKNKLLEDTVKWAKFTGIAWFKDGFYYSRYDAPKEGDKLSKKNEFHQVFYHKIGTSQSKDKLLFADRSHAQRNFNASTTDDQRFLVVSSSESTSNNSLMVKDLTSNSDEFEILVDNFKNDYRMIGNVGTTLFILTNLDAPNYRVVAIDVANVKSGFQEIISEKEDVLQNIVMAGDGYFVANYLKNAASSLRIYDFEGKNQGEIALPTLGNVTELNASRDDDKVFYSFTSFTQPTSIYMYDLEEKKSKILKSPKVDFKTNDYETKQVFYESKDGTKIPMFITHKKGIALNGNTPTLLYGYGGFNISQLPNFSVPKAVFLENGGIFALANIRGGGEFGKKWHEAGTKANKQNVFDDFESAAEYLIDKKYTSSEKLAIEGRSNGGLLIGACITQRPDLYKVALPTVGVLDMLRYHKFTIGWAWANDYGRSDNPDDFKYLYKYSPLHNVKKAAYPATLVTTADHDDRVVPAHSYKFISELQHQHKGNNPVLIRIDTSAGHGAGKSTSKQIVEAADILSFLFYNLGINPKR